MGLAEEASIERAMELLRTTLPSNEAWLRTALAWVEYAKRPNRNERAEFMKLSRDDAAEILRRGGYDDLSLGAIDMGHLVAAVYSVGLDDGHLAAQAQIEFPIPDDGDHTPGTMKDVPHER